MSSGVAQTWLVALSVWASGKPSIRSAWVFGSRAKNKHTQESDLDIALLLQPDDGKVLADWIFNAANWREEAQAAIGPHPRIDLQHAWPGEDEIVWPAVQAHGVLFFERDK
ncbi:MAG: nucleotidyltransferase domain-containing protein [Pseudomonadota bacterium]